MPNLSQIKRQKMLAFLDTIREEHKDDDDMLIALGEIESELNAKKYGLVWEQHEEAVDVQMQTHIPVFTEVAEREITAAPGEKYNFLLEGDNLHSLRLLEKTHKGKIDVIYIDPPYNTGSNDFTYDDKKIDKNDGYRHSKWISFMSERLNIAKNLLTTDGVIFVSIDENEQANLELLMNEIFGTQNKIGEFIWKGRSGKGGTNSQIAFQHEYVKVYAKDASVVNFYQIQTVSEKDKTENLRQWGDNGPFRLDRPTMFFPVLIKEGEYSLPSDEEILSLYEREKSVFNDIRLAEVINNYINKGYKVVLPKRKDSNDGYGRWRQGVPGFKNLISSKLLTHCIAENGEITLKKIIPSGKESTMALDSILDKMGTSSEGTKEIKRMFGRKVFDTTKPIELVKYLVSLGTFNKPNAIILDFFAGSGTTGEAVAKLNKKDNGSRTFIIATNNESNIAEKITYKRIQKVIEGYPTSTITKDLLFKNKFTITSLKTAQSVIEKLDKIILDNRDKYDAFSKKFSNNTLYLYGEHKKDSCVTGIPANLKYYKTDFVSKDADDVSDKLLSHIAEMVQLEHGVKIDSNEYLIILDDDAADALEQHWAEYPNIKGLYVSKNVLLTTEQNVLFSTVDIHIIPDYYFKFEMQEVGESW